MLCTYVIWSYRYALCIGMTAVINRNKTIEKLIVRFLDGHDIDPDMRAASKGAKEIISFEKKRKHAIKTFEKEKRSRLIEKKRKSYLRQQSIKDNLSKIDLELDDMALGAMDLKGLRDQLRRFKDERVWDASHAKIVEKLKLVTLGSDVARKYEVDYAAERARYLEVLGKIIAYKLSDGSDLGMVNFSGLEHQAEQVDTRPQKKRRKKKAVAAPPAEDAMDAAKTCESQ